MDDWRLVTEAQPWLVAARYAATVAELDETFRPTPQFRGAFPRLTALLSVARQSAVVLPTGHYKLFAWGGLDEGVRAWLSPAVSETVALRAAPDHRVLLECFGGITERFNEPAGNWLLNHNQALTAIDVNSDAAFLSDYDWAFKECGGIPIDMAQYYPVAWEANGNCVLCERATGGLIFFAPDHADKNLIPYGRCPMFTLHTHLGGGSLRQWVEAIAAQWSSQES
jgi:hypothetical protein